ncbi:hypothetical protein [Spiroplasma ixodetis]|uniref:hypothetical protein n=1 Tax=Spiroplasma ixodetis TaxID=2141 RepID=UPI002577BA15|nr:hypothetical protein [Spiroplasma ixodetis]
MWGYYRNFWNISSKWGGISRKIKYRTSPHMYLWRKQWNWMSSTMLFKQNSIV